MTTKDNILLCIQWFERAAEQARHWVNEDDWAEAADVIENWIIKDANEALIYLKEGIQLKQEEVNHD
jgi:hypothetical protein